MEALSDLIRLFRMQVDVYHNAQICGNWLYRESHLGDTCFHMVTKGECQLDVPGHLNTVLNFGDLVIFPREIPHTMGPVGDVFEEQKLVTFDQAQGLEGTGMLCGQACFDHEGSLHLLDALPEVFIVRYNEDHIWCCGLIKMIMEESISPSLASQVIVNRLSELLFIYALRQYLRESEENGGLLALYSDGRLQQAISAIHAEPARNWTLESLAKQASMSRTAFSERFRKLSGWTPVKYLTWWRMQLAWTKLSEGLVSALVAEQVGYQSEAAFSRAFQKHFGMTAGRVRRGEIKKGPDV